MEIPCPVRETRDRGANCSFLWLRRTTLDVAPEAVSIDAADSVRMENRVGSITVGKVVASVAPTLRHEHEH